MKNNIKNERVEVMALFGTEVTELLGTHIKFAGNVAMHFFDVIAGRERFQLEFNSRDLSWHLTPAM